MPTYTQTPTTVHSAVVGMPTYTQTPTTVHSAVVGMPTYTQTPPTSPYFITNATGLPNVIILKVMILILNTLTSSNSQSTLFFNHCVIAKSL